MMCMPEASIFNFMFNPLVVIPLFVVITELLLFIKIAYEKGFQVKSHKWLLIYLLIFLIAGIPSIFSYISASNIDATFWNILFLAINVFSFPVLIGFTLHYVNKGKILQNIYFLTLIFGSAFIISTIILFTPAVFSHNPNDTVMSHGIWFPQRGFLYEPLYITWLNSIVLACIVLFIRHGLKVEDKVYKKQSFFFAAVLILQTIVNVFTLVVSKNIFGTPLLSEGSHVTGILGIMFAYGILKYDLFVVNPSTISSNILEKMGEVVVVINQRYSIEFVNPALKTSFGYSPSDVTGKHIKTIFSESGFEEVILGPIKKGLHEIETEMNITTAAGMSVPATVSASATYNTAGTLEGITIVITDLSHIQELKDVTLDRNKLSAVMESMSDGILGIDSNGSITQANHAIVKLLGLESTELIVRKKVEDVLDLFEGQKKLLSSDFQQLYSTTEKNSFIRKEFVLHKANGIKRNLQITITPVTKQQSSSMEMILTIRDMTEEAELQEMKVDFVSMTAHELRTPLTAVRGYISLFQQEYSEGLNEEQKVVIERAQTASQRLWELVEGLLRVIRLERVGFTVDPKAESWNKLMGDALTDLKIKAAETQVQLTYIPPEKEVEMKLDPVRITEVIANLVNNAIKYSPRGSEVTIRTELKGDAIVTSIRDIGPGIPKDALPHLFEKFYRVPGKLEQTSRGTGLGLYISKKIVELHKGKIWVESEIGKGTTFIFSLPLDSNYHIENKDTNILKTGI